MEQVNDTIKRVPCEYSKFKLYYKKCWELSSDQRDSTSTVLGLEIGYFPPTLSAHRSLICRLTEKIEKMSENSVKIYFIFTITFAARRPILPIGPSPSGECPYGPWNLYNKTCQNVAWWCNIHNLERNKTYAILQNGLILIGRNNKQTKGPKWRTGTVKILLIHLYHP